MGGGGQVAIQWKRSALRPRSKYRPTTGFSQGPVTRRQGRRGGCQVLLAAEQGFLGAVKQGPGEDLDRSLGRSSQGKEPLFDSGRGRVGRGSLKGLGRGRGSPGGRLGRAGRSREGERTPAALVASCSASGLISNREIGLAFSSGARYVWLVQFRAFHYHKNKARPPKASIIPIQARAPSRDFLNHQPRGRGGGSASASLGSLG